MSDQRDLARFRSEETAQGLVEYALIIAVIAITVIVAMVFMRDQLSALFDSIGTTIGLYPGP